MASRRFPAPRPSRAGWVEFTLPVSAGAGALGAGAGAAAAGAAGASFAAPGFVSGAGFASAVGFVASFAASFAALAAAGASAGSAARPPVKMAAPMPILRTAVARLHLGQCVSCGALIDWKSSQPWPHLLHS